MKKLKYTENVFIRHAVIVALSVMAIAVILACFGYAIVAQIDHSMEEAQRERMPSILAAVDLRFQEVATAASQLMNDTNFQIVANSSAPLTSFERYRLYTFNQNLRYFIASHSLWDNVFLYLKKTDYYQEGVYSRTAGSIHDSWDYEIDLQAWKQALSSLKEPVYASLPSRQEADKRYAEVWFPIAPNRTDSLGALVIRLNTSTLMTMLNGMRSSNWEHLALMDQEGNIICSTIPQFTEISTQDYSTATIVSPLSGWTCISMTRNESIRQTAVTCRRILMYGSLLACLITIFSGLYSLLKSMRPLEQVYSVVAERNDGKARPRSSSEAGSYLAQSFREMAGDLDLAQTQLLKQRAYVRDHLLIRLLMPSWNGSFIYSPDIYSENGVHFASDVFFILMITYHDSHMQRKTQRSDGDEYLIQQKINTLAENMFREKYNAMFVTYDFNSVGIMNVPDGETFDAAAADVEKTCLSVMGDVQESFYLIPGFILSKAVRGAANLKDAVRECFDVDDYFQDEGKPLSGFTRCTEALTKLMTSAMPDKGSPNHWSEFEQAMQSGDFQAALTLAQDSFSRAETGTPAERSVCCYGLAGSLLTSLDEIEGASGVSIQEELMAAERLMACHTPEALQEEMKRLILEAQQAACNEISPQSDKKLEQIKEYVDTHYADCNLGVSELACQAQMSLSGLSRAFKRKMGCNLLDYINQVRVKAVMRELSETDRTLADIADRTGFTNTNTLSRNFKHFIGITPGKYKKFLRENNGSNKEEEKQ